MTTTENYVSLTTSFSSHRPFPVTAARVRRSPFASIRQVQETVLRWKQGGSIGYSRLASLKAMGLLPRKDGRYVVSPKYQ